MHTDVRMGRIKGEVYSKKHVIFHLRNYSVFRFFYHDLRFQSELTLRKSRQLL